MAKIKTFSKEEARALVGHLQANVPNVQSPAVAAHKALVESISRGFTQLELTPQQAKELYEHLQVTGPPPPGHVYLLHLFIACDIEQMTEVGIERQRRVKEAYETGGFRKAIGFSLGTVGYGDKKPDFSGPPTPESKTVHEIRAEFSNPYAKSQLIFCEVCGVETRHITPFAGYPFQCVINHGGTTKCHGCGYDVDFIARVVVTGQHEHKSYCTSCDKLVQTKGEVA